MKAAVVTSAFGPAPYRRLAGPTAIDIAGIVEADSLGNTNICLLQKADGRQSLDSLRRDTPHECHWTPVHLDIPTILVVDIGH